MSIASEITRLQNAKASLKTSINAKTDQQHQITTETLDDYSDFVDSITSGGGGGVHKVNTISQMNALAGVQTGDYCEVTIPNLYTPVEYLESSGTQYIDTGYSIIQGDNFEIKNVTPTADGCLLSSGTGSYQFIILCFPATPSTYFRNCANGTALQIRKKPDDTNIKIENGSIYFDDVLEGTQAFQQTPDTNLFIGKRANNQQYYVGKYGEMEIVNNGTTKRHLIPCYRNSDNEIGMYDYLDGTFYTNDGTGVFSKGNNATSITQIYRYNGTSWVQIAEI